MGSLGTCISIKIHLKSISLQKSPRAFEIFHLYVFENVSFEILNWTNVRNIFVEYIFVNEKEEFKTDLVTYVFSTH